MLIKFTCAGCGRENEMDHEDQSARCPSCGAAADALSSKYATVKNRSRPVKISSIPSWVWIVAAIFAGLIGIPFLTTVMDQHAVMTLIGIPAFICIYFLPSALGWKKRNRTAILLLNVFLGWTFIGWVVALVWAATKDRP